MLLLDHVVQSKDEKHLQASLSKPAEEAVMTCEYSCHKNSLVQFQPVPTKHLRLASSLGRIEMLCSSFELPNSSALCSLQTLKESSRLHLHEIYTKGPLKHQLAKHPRTLKRVHVDALLLFTKVN